MDSLCFEGLEGSQQLPRFMLVNSQEWSFANEDMISEQKKCGNWDSRVFVLSK